MTREHDKRLPIEIPEPDVVELENGTRVRERFAFVSWLTIDGKRIGYVGRVRVVDGEPELVELAITCTETDGGAPCALTASDLESVDLIEVLEGGVAAEALRHTARVRRLEVQALDDDETTPASEFGSEFAELLEEHYSSAVRKARTGKRHRVTPLLLERVLELYAQPGGIRNVQRALQTSERNARRLVARARQEESPE